PALIHVLTTKGKGYKPAEDDPGTFHGVGPFTIKTGKKITSGEKTVSYTEVFGNTLSQKFQPTD
ncbi:MAG: hypothetical protein KJO32_03215, partial [Deltaproteobacteria bacterium]|nr:hypothetical protein [Deltaproteobacteria bacterium]